MIKANELELNQELLNKLYQKRMKKIEKSIIKQNNKGRNWTWSYIDIRIEDWIVSTLREMGYSVRVERFPNGDPNILIEW